MHLVDSGLQHQKWGGVLIQGKGNYCSKLKRGMLKIKKLLKTTS